MENDKHHIDNLKSWIAEMHEEPDYHQVMGNEALEK